MVNGVSGGVGGTSTVDSEGYGDGDGVGAVEVQATRAATSSQTDARANLGQRSDIVISLLLAISGVESRTS